MGFVGMIVIALVILIALIVLIVLLTVALAVSIVSSVFIALILVARRTARLVMLLGNRLLLLLLRLIFGSLGALALRFSVVSAAMSAVAVAVMGGVALRGGLVFVFALVFGFTLRRLALFLRV